MSPTELAEEEQEMREWFREVKTGSKLIKWGFSFLMAIGAAYLMIRSITHQ